MLSLTSGQLAALQARTVVRRWFIWVRPTTFSGSPAPVGYWDDIGAIEVQGRVYYGSGSIIDIGSVPASSDGSVSSVDLAVNGINEQVEGAIRGERLDQAPITLSIGLFDPVSRNIIDGLIPLFEGQIDKVEITTPPEGGEGRIVATIESVSRALEVESTQVRSDAARRRLWSNDSFYRFVNDMKGKKIAFGTALG